MKNPLSEKPILSTTIIFLIDLVILGVLVFPKYQKFQELQSKIKINETDLKNNEEYLTSLNEIYSKAEGMKSQLAKIDSALPSELFLPSFLDFLQKTVSENGLILTNVSLSETLSLKTTERIKETSLSLSVSGSYSAFKNFLSGLEKSARLIEIPNISFSSLKESPVFDLTIKIHSY